MNTKERLSVDMNNTVKIPKKRYFTDIERELEARFIRGLRKTFQPAFEKDQEFIYNEDEEVTSLIITTQFPDSVMLSKTPHIFMMSSSFGSNAQETMNNNFFNDVNIADIGNYARSSLSTIPYTCTFECLGEYDTSRNLANKMFYFVRFLRYEFFSDYLLLNITNVSKQPTGPTAQFPEPIFSTTISISGYMTLQHIRAPEGYKFNEKLLVPEELEGVPFNKVDTRVGLQKRRRK